MPHQLRTYRVFLASPGGLERIRGRFRDAVLEYSDNEAWRRGLRFEPIGWEDVSSGMGRPQSLINPLLNRADFAVFGLRDRWGSPSDLHGKYSSGTEEEWECANQLYSEGRILGIQIYFFPVARAKANAPDLQLKAVWRFKARLEDGKLALHKSLKRDAEFERLLRKTLGEWAAMLDAAKGGKDELRPYEDASAAAESSAIERPGLLELSWAHAIEGNVPLALDTLTRGSSSLAVSTERARADILRARYLIRLDRPHEAIETIRALPGKLREVSNEEARAALAVEGLIVKVQAYIVAKEFDAAIAASDAIVAEIRKNAPSSPNRILLDALTFKSDALLAQLRYAEALQTYDELLAVFLPESALHFRERTAAILFNKAATLGRMGRVEDEIAIYGTLIDKYKNDVETVMKERVSRALIDRALTEKSLGRTEKSRAGFLAVLDYLRGETDPTLLAKRAVAEGELALQILQHGSAHEAGGKFEEILSWLDATNEATEEAYARTMTFVAEARRQLGDSEGELSKLNEVVRRFSGSRNDRVRHVVVSALFSAALEFKRAAERDRELPTYEKIIAEFESSDSEAILDVVAKARLNRAVLFETLERWDDALVAFDATISNLVDQETTVAHEAMLMAYKGRLRCLERLHDEEAIRNTFEEIVDRYATERDPKTRIHAASLVYGRGDALLKAGHTPAALALMAAASKLSDRVDTDHGRRILAASLCGQAAAAADLGRYSEARTLIGALLDRFALEQDATVRQFVAVALEIRNLIPPVST